MPNRHMAYISLGSNKGDPEGHLARARLALADVPGLCIEAQSPVYLTEPQLVRDQPWFANQVLKVSCPADMTAQAFLSMLLQQEQMLGRVRDQNPDGRYGPRIIDIDLLLFDQERHQMSSLILPHPRIMERAFILVPLRDMEPALTLPDGRTPDEALRSLVYAVEGNRIRQ